MITLKNKIKALGLMAISAIAVFTSCNKDVQQFGVPTVPTYPTGSRIGTTIAANPDDSLYYKLILRSGQLATLNDSTKEFTVFATNNAGVRKFINTASGGAIPINAPDVNFVNFINNLLPATTAAQIILYNTVGQKFSNQQTADCVP